MANSRSLEQQADCWVHVVDKLSEANPNLMTGPGTGLQCVMRELTKMRNDQAKLDALMFEHCPRLMTAEQLVRFEKNVGTIWTIEIDEEKDFVGVYPGQDVAANLYLIRADTKIEAIELALKKHKNSK